MYFITGNEEKFNEVKSLLPQVEQLTIDLPEIQSSDPQAIIAAKLEVARQHHAGEFIVEDTGLYFDCLHGLPGPLIKWFLKHMGAEGLATLPEKLGNAQAQAITWIGYAPLAGDTQFFEGSVSGTIVTPRGDGGFGWDKIFLPDGESQTYGEMSRSQKNTMSMRKRAVEKLQQFLTTAE